MTGFLKPPKIKPKNEEKSEIFKVYSWKKMVNFLDYKKKII